MSAGAALLLLNNDAQLLPGRRRGGTGEPSRGDPSIGAVGGRVILSDGTLQEAGSIVWNDGTCLGYGRGRSPNDPEFMFRRDVDYCSGAFLLTPTALFRRLGGFDERYAPAYYEETDYCVRLVEGRAARRVRARRGHPAPRVRQRRHRQRRGYWSCSGATGAVSRRVHADWLRGQLPPSQLERTAGAQGAPRAAGPSGC